MSRIGKAIINLPDGVEVSVSNENVVTVKGKKGELTQPLSSRLKLNIDDGVLELVRSDEEKDTKAQHGMSRALINNMIEGVSNGFTIQQELVGVGYRAKAQGQNLELTLGLSHPIVFQVPGEVNVKAETEKGKPPLITLESHDKQLVGQVAAKIRSFRKPEPFKGKGIRYKGERLRRKAGKSAAK